MVRLECIRVHEHCFTQLRLCRTAVMHVNNTINCASDRSDIWTVDACVSIRLGRIERYCSWRFNRLVIAVIWRMGYKLQSRRTAFHRSRILISTSSIHFDGSFSLLACNWHIFREADLTSLNYISEMRLSKCVYFWEFLYHDWISWNYILIGTNKEICFNCWNFVIRTFAVYIFVLCILNILKL